MNLPKLEIIEGDVVKVQLTSETRVAGRGGAKASEKVLVSSKITNRMRVFLLGADGREQDFQFANSTVGVREGHRVAVVRAKPAGPGPWLTVALYNLTTQVREEQIGAFARAARQQWLGVRWRAAFWALGVFVFYWPLSEILPLAERQRGPGIALALAILTYPFASAIGWIVDRLVLPARQREAEKALRFAIEERMSEAKQDREAAAQPPKEEPAPANDVGDGAR